MNDLLFKSENNISTSFLVSIQSLKCDVKYEFHNAFEILRQKKILASISNNIFICLFQFLELKFVLNWMKLFKQFF